MGTDTFEPGAWFPGHLYPERSDVSPDGAHLIYLAADFSAHRLALDFGQSWTAVSKAPWLTALAAWKNDMVYYGGGYFETDIKVRVNEPRGLDSPLVPPPPGLAVDFANFGSYHRQVLDRLARLGWEVVSVRAPSDGMSPWNEGTDAVLRKRQPGRPADSRGGGVFLEMTSSSPGYTPHDACTFALVNSGGGGGKDSLPVPGATWADWDQRGRLVYAKEGKLFAVNVAATLPAAGGAALPSVELADFNPSKPHRTKSPAWARKW
jgi:hypothetical protein